MPEHQQTQKSTESKTTSQKQATPRIQAPISHPMAIIQRARMNPKSLTHADVMQLQSTIGNRAVVRLLTEIGAIPSKAKQAPPVQRQELVQRQEIPEEEEPLQGKFESGLEKETCPSCMQRQEIPEEEEPLQGKFENKPEIACPSCFTSPIVQRQEIPEEEEPLQGKMIGTIQRQEIPEEKEPLQKKSENNTGMPDNLKAGVESLSGIDMSDVRVHYNSSKPVEVGALAYTQGTDIHVAPGQERHLPHEAWHVVQQMQGRVQPTMQMKGLGINDDPLLEHEADIMGAKTAQFFPAPDEEILQGKFGEEVAQKAEKAPNNTGLPDNLKAGIENLSGMNMGGVKVHHNSGKPAALNTLAYAQGTDIHEGSGQERHLPHEAWHVVQQQAARQSLSSVNSPIQLMVEFAADRTIANADFNGLGVRRMGANHTTAHGLYEAIAERAVTGKDFVAAIERLRALIENLIEYPGYVSMQPGEKAVFLATLQAYVNAIPAPATVLECNWAAKIERLAGDYIYLRGLLLYSMHNEGEGGVTQNGEGVALGTIRGLLSAGYNSNTATDAEVETMVTAVLRLFDFRSWGPRPGPESMESQFNNKFLPAILQHVQSIRDLSPDIVNSRFGVNLLMALKRIPSMAPMSQYFDQHLLWRLHLV